MKKLNLLLLEDNLQDAHLIQATIKRAEIQFDATLVSHEQDFIAALQKNTYNVVLIDNNLPQFDAMSALRILKEKKINLPIILVSGAVSEEFAVQIMMAGAWDYVFKDKLARLPAAILNAIKKYDREIDYQNKIDEIIRKEGLMKEAERLAHLGSWENNVLEQRYYWSDEFYRILGYEVGEVTPSKDHLLARVHPDDVAYVNEQMRDAKAQSNSIKYAYRIIPESGVVRFVESEVFITRNEHREIIRINGFTKDVTESKLAELELKKTERKYRNLFENNPVPMWVMEEGSLRFVDVNNATIQHYGYTRDEFLSMNALDIRPLGEKDRFLKEEKTLKDFGDLGLWEHQKKDGTIITVQVTIDKIMFDDRKCRLILANDVTSKTAAEKKLQHTMLRLEQAQGIAHIGSWELNLSTGVSHWSDEACKIYGLGPDDNVQSYESWLSFIHPEDADAMVSKIGESNATLKGSDFYHRIIRRDGTIRYIHSEYEFEMTDGKPVGLYGISHDVTETKEAENRLKHTALRLQQAQGIAHIGSWEHDLLTDKLTWSEEANRMYGLDPANGMKSFQNWKTFIHPEDAEMVFAWIKRSAESLSSIPCNYRIVRHDGAIRHIYAQFEHELGGDGKPISRYGIMHDITEMKEAELALKQSEANLRLIMDLIPQSISVRNIAGEFVFVNKRLAELYGTSPEKLVGKSIRSVIPKENNDEEFVNRDREIIHTGEIRIMPELNFTDAKGYKRIFHITKVPYTLAGNEKAILGIGTEITHQKQAEAERMKMMADIVNRNKDLEQFSYIVSHSLRAPVANILGIADLVKNENLSDDELSFLLNGLTESVKKLDDLVMDLNEITQLSHTIGEFKEEVNFSDLLVDVKSGIGNLISTYDVSINADFGEVNSIHSVHKYMHSIFHNLITNSIKYKKKDTALICNILSKRNNDNIELYFKDNGAGLDLSKTGDQLFDLYKRYHLGVAGNKKMGLFMVKAQVEDLGGHISVTSEVSKGTEFKIVLPLLNAVA